MSTPPLSIRDNFAVDSAPGALRGIMEAFWNPTYMIAEKKLRENHVEYTLGRDIPQKPYLPPEVLGQNKEFEELAKFHEDFVSSVDPVTKKETKIGLWVKEPADNSKPVFVMFHGRTGHWGYCIDPREPKAEGFNPLYRLGWLKAAAESGAGVIAVHSRGCGLSNAELVNGKKDATAESYDMDEENYRQDMRAVAEYVLKRKGYAPDRLIVTGESLGAAMAAMLAETMTNEFNAPPKMLGLVSTFTSMPDAVQAILEQQRALYKQKWGLRWDRLKEMPVEHVEEIMPQRFSTKDRLNNLNDSTMVYISHHGSDERIDYCQAETNIKAARDRGLTHHVRWQDGEHALKDETGITKFPHTSWNPVAIIKDMNEIYMHGKLPEKEKPLRQKGWLPDKKSREFQPANGHVNGIATKEPIDRSRV